MDIIIILMVIMLFLHLRTREIRATQTVEHLPPVCASCSKRSGPGQHCLACNEFYCTLCAPRNLKYLRCVKHGPYCVSCDSFTEQETPCSNAALCGNTYCQQCAPARLTDGLCPNCREKAPV